MSDKSLVMTAWNSYTSKLRDVERAARTTPRLPDATGIYLSEATGCPRKASLRLLKYKAAAMSEQSKVNIASGIRGEEKIALVLEACGWHIERQMPIQTKYGNGRIDIVADIRHWQIDQHPAVWEDRPLIIEIKTSKIDQLKWLPRREHMDQAILYMGFFDDGPIAPMCELVYLLKSDHANDNSEKVTAFSIEWDKLRFDYLIAQLDLIDDHVRRRIPVPIELAGKVEPTRPPCAYPNAGKCQYWSHCWGDTHAATDDETLEF